jgi:hypothetical protein
MPAIWTHLELPSGAGEVGSNVVMAWAECGRSLEARRGACLRFRLQSVVNVEISHDLLLEMNPAKENKKENESEDKDEKENVRGLIHGDPQIGCPSSAQSQG